MQKCDMKNDRFNRIPDAMIQFTFQMQKNDVLKSIILSLICAVGTRVHILSAAMLFYAVRSNTVSELCIEIGILVFSINQKRTIFFSLLSKIARFISFELFDRWLTSRIISNDQCGDLTHHSVQATEMNI